jgi:uncharacterized protein (DUF736 family)
MPAIGYVTRLKDGSFKGEIRTLSVSADITIIPNRGKTGEQPDYRVLAAGVELGGGWIRTGEVSQREYIRLSMSALNWDGAPFTPTLDGPLGRMMTTATSSSGTPASNPQKPAPHP